MPNRLIIGRILKVWEYLKRWFTEQVHVDGSEIQSENLDRILLLPYTMGGDAVVELAGKSLPIELGNDRFLLRQRDPDDSDGGRRGDLRPAGQHRRRQAQLLSTYSSSFCSFSGKNISFVRTLFSV